MTDIALSLAPRRSALIQGHDTEVDVMVRLMAPEAPGANGPRSPLNLAIVLDRSGSMGGRPLAEAKRCAAFMIDNMTDRDRVALVSFDTFVRIDAASEPATPQHRARLAQKLRGLHAGASTALHAGWLAGAEQAAAHAHPGAVSRVLILTDGQANVGEREPKAISSDCARLAEAGVTTSTYGLGARFDEDLLTAMADGGQGQSYYGETANDLMDPFREEFDLLSALVGRKLRLQFEFAPGVTGEVLNKFDTDSEGRCILPDLAYGGVAWAVARLRVPADLAEPGRSDVHLLTVHAAYDTLTGDRRSCAPAHLRLPRVPPEAFAGLAEDAEVTARAQELRVATLQEEIRVAAYDGDWERVRATVAQAREEAAGNAWVAETLDALQHFVDEQDANALGKEAKAKAWRMRKRLALMGEGLEWLATAEAAKPSYLRRKPRQGQAFDDPGAPKAD